MMKLAAFILILLLPCAYAFAHAASYAQWDAAVLSTIIADRCAHSTEPGNTNILVLSSEASTIEVTDFPSEFDKDAVQSLKTRNKGNHQLPQLSLCKSFERVTGSKLEAIFRQSGWPEFYKAYPSASGTFHLSLPGYSLNGKTAIVQVSISCGGLCGSGFYWVLHNVNGKWLIVERSGAWIS